MFSIAPLVSDVAALTLFVYLCHVSFSVLPSSSRSPADSVAKQANTSRKTARSKRVREAEQRSWLFCCWTYHTRFHPVRHSFRYPVFYVGVDLDDLENGRCIKITATQEVKTSPFNAIKGFLFGYDSTAIVSLRSCDYLGQVQEDKTGLSGVSIKEKLMHHLRVRGVKHHLIDRVLLVTTPRLLGYGFNPVSYYYCYSSSRELVCIVLEVNNTFGEKHLYVLDYNDEGTMEQRARSGYTKAHLIPRKFHVSPFNDRSGAYTIYTADLFPTHDGNDRPILNTRIIIQSNPDPQLRRPSGYPLSDKKFMAEVHGEGIPLTATRLLMTIFRYAGSVFLTMPRIMKEAAVLAYRKHLDIYPRPEPIFDQRQDTVSVKSATSFERYAMSLVSAWIEACLVLSPNETGVSIHLPDANDTILSVGEQSSAIHVHLSNYAFFSNLLLFDDIWDGLLAGYEQGAWWTDAETDSKDLKRLLHLLLGSPSLGAVKPVRTHWLVTIARRMHSHTVAGVQDQLMRRASSVLNQLFPNTTHTSPITLYRSLRGRDWSPRQASNDPLTFTSYILPQLPPIMTTLSRAKEKPAHPIDSLIFDDVVFRTRLGATSIKYGLNIFTEALSQRMEAAVFGLIAQFASHRGPFEGQLRIWSAIHKIVTQEGTSGLLYPRQTDLKDQLEYNVTVSMDKTQDTGERLATPFTDEGEPKDSQDMYVTQSQNRVARFLTTWRDVGHVVDRHS
ncbi:hypothetical protein BZG36_00283 [Bifiguratus adelaidae]|uniref:Uncharacterized protein n=1 Tax=Bifiguratus adelaidae TaxID=1938954 RepID=A0A261Y8F1_9FUNG|nr:hypothetical protein BZG36_00283 [Bifiguratus adelaidae]